MVKGIKIFRCLIIAVTVLTLSLTVYGFYSVPDEIYCVAGENLSVSRLFKITCDNRELSDSPVPTGQGSYDIDVSLFGAIPIKSSSLTVSSRYYVIPSGKIFGLRLFTQGVVVIRTDKVDTSSGSVSPGENAGLRAGDIIISADGKSINSSSDLALIFSDTVKTRFSLKYIRQGKEYETELTTAYSVSERKNKAGLWIRDSAAGIGTLTFYEAKSKVFAGLGHGVCDIDTGDILPLSDGDIVSARIGGCYKGENGRAGELCGSFLSETMGVLTSNNSHGVYGVLTGPVPRNGEAIPVAGINEVTTGKAQIISCVDEKGPSYYDIEIIRVSVNDDENKNMVIKVTDDELIEKTGGIVQGMSGSPIIQRGMLVGAVTHVLINDPTKGYGIFASTMLETARSLTDN